MARGFRRADLREKKDFLSIRQQLLYHGVTGVKQIVKFPECMILYLPGNPYNLCAVNLLDRRRPTDDRRALFTIYGRRCIVRNQRSAVEKTAY